MGLVSHETDEPDESVVSAVFGQSADSARRYVELLVTAGIEAGLIGPRESGRIWSRHILNCAVIAPLFDPAASLCDVGSGAGLPGIVLALSRPDLRVTLVEPQLRRYSFLAEVVERLALSANLVRCRAENLPTQTFDYVTARAVAPLDRLVEWTCHLWSPAGQLVAIKGSSVPEELQRAAPTLRRLGLSRGRIEQWGAGVVNPPTTIVRIQSPTNGPT